MNGIVRSVSDAVPDRCHANDCNRDGCSISVRTAASRKVIIDLDCPALGIPRTRKRCDYVLVGEKSRKSWVVPIELKSGRFQAAEVVDQIQGGADEAKSWLPEQVACLFIPILAHGKSFRRKQLAEFRSTKVTFRGHRKQIEVVRCGEKLKDVLDRNA